LIYLNFVTWLCPFLFQIELYFILTSATVGKSQALITGIYDERTKENIEKKKSAVGAAETKLWGGLK
jgi:hypothetical protein